MKALQYMGPNVLELREVENPVLKSGEVLVKIRACGICGSDVHGWLGKTGRRIPPMTMGHEFSGEIAELGADANRFRAGDRVIVHPVIFCGECDFCKQGMTNMCRNKRFFGVMSEDGALAEYLAVPENMLFKMTDNCSFETGAMAEPYAVAYGAVKKAGDLRGKDVLILGAGMIGLCVLQLVKLGEPASITVSDLSDKRLELAKKLGADYTINSKNEDPLEAVKKYTDGRMMDISIEAVGIEPTANFAICALKPAATAVWVGLSQRKITIDMQEVVNFARKIYGTYIYTFEEFGEVVDILCSGKLATDALLSGVVSLEEAEQAFKNLLNEPDKYIKIVVDPSK